MKRHSLYTWEKTSLYMYFYREWRIFEEKTENTIICETNINLSKTGFAPLSIFWKGKSNHVLTNLYFEFLWFYCDYLSSDIEGDKLQLGIIVNIIFFKNVYISWLIVLKMWNFCRSLNLNKKLWVYTALLTYDAWSIKLSSDSRRNCWPH